jgi:hypothetical protein
MIELIVLARPILRPVIFSTIPRQNIPIQRITRVVQAVVDTRRERVGYQLFHNNCFAAESVARYDYKCVDSRDAEIVGCPSCRAVVGLGSDALDKHG